MKQIITLISFIIVCTPLFGLPEYAVQSGQPCAHCHLSPEGGGGLTSSGIAYAQEKNHSKFKISQIFFFIVRFFHILFAFLWIGTILYVHLILKPAYASGGLPPSEVKVGIISMVVIGITGITMTIYQFPDIYLIFQSAFGLFLFIKIVIYLIMVTSAIFVVTTIGPKLHSGKTTTNDIIKGGLTLSQLKEFDGKNGKPAYICFKGKIYDITESKKWQDGVHFKQHHAGTDLTSSMARAPHTEEKLSKFDIVANLVANHEDAPLKYKKIFYSIAYGNLFFIFLVLIILTIWKK